jgi:hypothetical protein
MSVRGVPLCLRAGMSLHLSVSRISLIADVVLLTSFAGAWQKLQRPTKVGRLHLACPLRSELGTRL